MEFPKDLYDPKTLDLMQWAFDTAWEEVEYALAGSQIDRTGLRTIMSVRIMAAVRDGARPRAPQGAGAIGDRYILISRVGLDYRGKSDLLPANATARR